MSKSKPYLIQADGTIRLHVSAPISNNRKNEDHDNNNSRRGRPGLYRRLNLEEFKPGMCVGYLPGHAKSATDIEWGIVSSKNDKYVFVKFGAESTPKACYPTDLVNGEP